MNFQADIDDAVGQVFRELLVRNRKKFRPWLHKAMLEIIQDHPGGMERLEQVLVNRPLPLAPGEEYTPEQKVIIRARLEMLQHRAREEWSAGGSLDDYFAPTPEKDAARERELAWAVSDTLESRLGAIRRRMEGGITIPMDEQVKELAKEMLQKREALIEDVDASIIHGDPETNVYLKDIPLEESLRTLQGIADEIEKKREELENRHD